MQKTLRIKNDIHELSMMNEFLEEAGEELGLSTAFMMSLNLVMEEAVSNIIFYAYKGDVEDAVDISLVREGGELIVTLIDHGLSLIHIYIKSYSSRNVSTSCNCGIGSSCKSVSYTHLDVYKRQAYTRFLIRI